MSAKNPQIVYTLTDEAPFLATASFLPIIRTFAEPAGIDVVASDISVAARILGEFADLLPESQRQPNNLSALGKLTLKPEANIISQQEEVIGDIHHLGSFETIDVDDRFHRALRSICIIIGHLIYNSIILIRQGTFFKQDDETKHLKSTLAGDDSDSSRAGS